MFVTELDIQGEPGDQDAHRTVEQPTLDEVEAAIRSLDGEWVTCVMLSTGGELPHMAVAGGSENRHIAYVTYDNWTFHNLRLAGAPVNEAARFTQVVAGQLVDYAEYEYVDLQTTLAAARTFAMIGTLDTPVRWETQ